MTTALNVAIAAEDYGLAARIRDRLSELTDGESERSADWRKLGIPEWLASRAECMGYRFPTGGPPNSTTGTALLLCHFSIKSSLFLALTQHQDTPVESI